MSTLRRLVLLRHGNTVGNSHERFHGQTDVELSEEGRAQVRAAGRTLSQEVFDRVVSSPLARAWQSAALLAGPHPVMLLPEFREVDFGHWEGLTAEEIEARDPALSRAWRERAPDFEYPGGELREAFRKRVMAGFAALQASGAAQVLAVTHKGVIRVLLDELCDSALADGEPALGGVVSLTRVGDRWQRGRRSSDPELLRAVA